MELLYIDDLYNLQFKKGPLSALYFSEMPARLPGNTDIIVSDACFNYINALNNIYGPQPIMGCFDKYDKQMQYLSVNVKDTGDLKIINDWLAQYENYQWPVLNRETDISDSDSLFRNEFKEYHKSLKILGKYDYLLKGLYTEIKMSCLDKMLDDFDGDLTGQLLCTYNLMLLQDYRMLDEEMIVWIQENITEPVLKKVMLENHASHEESLVKFADFAPGTYILDSIPVTSSADDLFNQIINRFKGKIIYIDFWADWCSPCRAEFPYADVLKKEYADKDLVFLYLGVSCEQDNWTKMIRQKQLSGYHYWLNKEQSRQLLDKFMITGIPHFLLVDENGNVINEEAPRPSSKAVIREKLDQLLSLLR